MPSVHRTGKGLLLLSLLGAAGLSLSASGCQKEKDDELRNCNVPALFASSCAGSGCHGADAPRANLDLESPGLDDRLFHVLGTSTCDERKLVVPGHPEESLLYIKVTDSSPFCGDQMPPGRSLSKSELACLKNYIEVAGTDTDGNTCETCGDEILCVDTERDPNHCGGCDQACDAGLSCIGGSCMNPCSDGEIACNGTCVDLNTSDNNCGECSHRCGPGSTCEAGVCACDSAPTGMAGGSAGSSVPSFQDDILPVFDVSCAGGTCHQNADDGEAAPLDLTAADAYAHLVDVTAEDCGEMKYVVPGSPDQSYLVEKLMGGNVCAGERMPLMDEPLPNEGIARVVNWICAGAPDN